MKNVFIRGSVVRYVHLPGAAVDTALLEDATRRGKLGSVNALGWELRADDLELQKLLLRRRRLGDEVWPKDMVHYEGRRNVGGASKSWTHDQSRMAEGILSGSLEEIIRSAPTE